MSTSWWFDARQRDRGYWCGHTGLCRLVDRRPDLFGCGGRGATCKPRSDFVELAIDPDVRQELEPHLFDRDRRVERGNTQDQAGRLSGRPTQPSAAARPVPSALTASSTVVNGVASDEFENDADKSEHDAMGVIGTKRR